MAAQHSTSNPNYKHGHACKGKLTRVYRAWLAMLQRCLDPKQTSWPRYGGRGITVCERWQGDNGFINFLADMGEPQPGQSIDRIDNNKGYSPENCRWATSKEQNRNRRDNLLINFNGETLCLSAWAEKLGMTYDALKNRMQRGWTIEQTLTTPRRWFGRCLRG